MKWLLIALLVSAVIAGAALLLWKQPTRGEIFYFSCETGQSYIYNLSVSQLMKGEAPNQEPASQAPSSEMRIDSEMVMRCIKEGNGIYQVAFSLRKPTRQGFLLMADELLPDSSVFDDVFSQELLAEISEDGTIQSMDYQENAHSLFKKIMPYIVTELQIVNNSTTKERAWETTERNQYGTLQNNYRINEGANGQFSVEKDLQKYLSVYSDKENGLQYVAQAHYSAEYENHSTLKLLSGHHVLMAKEKEKRVYKISSDIGLQLKKVVHTMEDRGTLADQGGNVRKRHVFDDPKEQEELERKLYLSQADNLTIDELAAWIDEINEGAEFSGKEIFLMKKRLIALLKLDPALCLQVEAQFFKSMTARSGQAKMILLNSLISAGHKEAQQSFVNLMGNEQVKEDNQYVEMLQQASFLSNPEKNTARFIENIHKDKSQDTDVLTASAYTLGSLAGELIKKGNVELGQGYNRLLRDEIRNTSEPEQVYHLLFSIKNVAIADNFDIFQEYSQNGDPMLRRAAVRGLQNIESDKAFALLNEKIDDESIEVQAAALQTLGKYDLCADSLAKVSERFFTKKDRAEDTEMMMVHLFEKNIGKYPDVVKGYLEKMLRDGVSSGRLEQKIKSLL